jgi:hypothetical protein
MKSKEKLHLCTMKILPLLFFCALTFVECNKSNDSANSKNASYSLNFILGKSVYKYSYSVKRYGAAAACFTGYSGGFPIINMSNPDHGEGLIVFGIPSISSFSNSDNFLDLFIGDSTYEGHAIISSTTNKNEDSTFSGIFYLNGKVLSSKGADSLSFSATATVSEVNY